MRDVALESTWASRARSGLGAVALVVLVWAGMPLRAAAEDSGDEPPVITVSGRAEVPTSPDVVYVTLAVESMKPTAAEAAEDNSVRAERVIAAAKKFVEKTGQISTSGFRLIPVYETPSKRPQEPGEKRTLVGYEAQNEVTVELHDTTRAGGLIDAAIAAGADRVAGMRFDLADRSTTMRQAVAEAGRDARAQAEALAGALGVQLGNVRAASTIPEPLRLPQERAFGRAVMAAAQTPIEPGDVVVSATVHVTYEITP